MKPVRATAAVLALAFALSGCGGGQAANLAKALGVSTDEAASIIARQARATGQSADEAADALGVAATSAYRLDIPDTPAVEAACSTFSATVFSDDPDFSVAAVGENLVEAIAGSNNQVAAEQLRQELQEYYFARIAGEDPSLMLLALRQSYCAGVLAVINH